MVWADVRSFIIATLFLHSCLPQAPSAQRALLGTQSKTSSETVAIMLCTIFHLLLLTVYLANALPGRVYSLCAFPPIIFHYVRSDDEYMNENMQQRNIFQELIENRRRLYQVG
jgi:hypothetical protein